MLVANFLKISLGLFLISTVFLNSAQLAKASENLIINPGLESASAGGLPLAWYKAGWGTNTAEYNYPVEGREGGKAAEVVVQSIASGDLKWGFNHVAVTAGETYVFSDYYKSDQASELTIEYLMSDGSYNYVWIENLPPSLDWQNYSTDIEVIDGAVSLTVYHLIFGVGSLSVDDFSLVAKTSPPPPPATIVFTDPQDNSTVSGNIDVIVETSNAPNPSVQFTLDGLALGEPYNTAPFTMVLDTTGVANGEHVLGAVLYYGEGQNMEAESIRINVNNSVLPTDNLVTNAGLELSSSGTAPDNWYKGGWGNNLREYTYPVTGYNSERAAKVAISSYSNGDVKWFFEDVAVEPGSAYTFSNNFKSTTNSAVNLRYLMNDGTYRYEYVEGLSASSDWQDYSACIFVPETAVSMSVFHLIASIGSLTVDNYSVTKGCDHLFNEGMLTISFDDSSVSQYENAFPIMQAHGFQGTFYIGTGASLDPYNTFAFHEDAILEMQLAGNEMGAHTVNHPYLTEISIEDAEYEINNSRTSLLAIGASPVNTFAYPYGAYNESVLQLVKDAGFTSARSVTQGFNTKNADPYKLMTMHVNRDVSPAQVAEWIEEAKANNVWLILMYHQIVENGDIYSTTPLNFQATMDAVSNSGIRVVTVSEGLGYMSN